MLQPVSANFQNLIYRQMLKRTGNAFVKTFLRHTSSRCQGCQRNILKDLQSCNFKHIQSLGFTPIGLLKEYEKFIIPVTQKRSSQTKSGDPPGGKDGKGTPDPTNMSSGGDSPAASPGSSTDSESKEKSSKITKMTKKKPFDYSNYTTNIYILPMRAITEYLLQPKDLDNIPKYMRRSPFRYGEMITVFKRTDVEKRAIEKWGSLEYISEKKRTAALYGYSVFGYDSSPLKQKFESMSGQQSPLFGDHMHGKKEETFSESGSAKVVKAAVIVNLFNMALKFIAWRLTGSDSMFSETLHSGADTFNQIVLLYGLYKSMKQPDSGHPYGYTNVRYIYSLFSGLMIFFMGAGCSWYHAILAFCNPELMEFNAWAVGTLAFSFITESISLYIAIREAKKSAKKKNKTLREHVKRGEDPNVNVVLLEDLASVSGVVIATGCMSAAHYFQNSYFDSAGSVLIGGILAYVAFFIIRTNSGALIGKSISAAKQAQITQELEQDRMIRSVHDVKATEMGGEIRYKAEVDFDGGEMTLAYLDTVDQDLLMKEMQAVKTPDDARNIILNHGDKLISRPGEEIDRIEKKLKTKHPDLRHVDLEAL